MPDGTKYLLDSINRKLTLILNSRTTKKQEQLIDGCMIDVERLREQIRQIKKVIK